MSFENTPMYKLGREARRFGYGREACNLPKTRRVAKAWWLAGWHDEDMQIEQLAKIKVAA